MCPVSCIQMWVGFWGEKVNRYACLNTHARMRVCAHTCCTDICACMNMNVWTLACRYETCFSIVLPYLHQNVSSARLCSQTWWHHPDIIFSVNLKNVGFQKDVIQDTRKHMVELGPFTSCKATVLYGSVHVWMPTFSIPSLSFLMLFHITPAVYGV